MSELSIPAAQTKRNTTSQHHTDSVRSAANPLQISVRIYKPEELDHKHLTTRVKEVLEKVAFSWQIEIGAAALCGEDVEHMLFRIVSPCWPSILETRDEYC